MLFFSENSSDYSNSQTGQPLDRMPPQFIVITVYFIIFDISWRVINNSRLKQGTLRIVHAFSAGAMRDRAVHLKCAINRIRYEKQYL